MYRQLTIISLLLAAITARSATVTRGAEAVVFQEDTPDGCLSITFRKCMANELFTFHEVSLDGEVVNSAAHSDNIGPFLVSGHGWIGGNHLSDNGRRTAETTDIRIMLDGKEMARGTTAGKRLDVIVTNRLYLTDGSLFATETVEYTACGNSLEVCATHDYATAADVTVERYYGMQSMFEGETAVLIPNPSIRQGWHSTATASPIKIKKADLPAFCAFVEKSPAVCQASLILPAPAGRDAADLADRHLVAADDVVFIGNSHGKCYHKLIGDTVIHPGDNTIWHGVYSWFKSPVKDTYSTGSPNPEFSYSLVIDGIPAIVTI